MKAKNKTTIEGVFSQGKLLQRQNCDGLFDEVAASVEDVQAFVEECQLALSSYPRQ